MLGIRLLGVAAIAILGVSGASPGSGRVSAPTSLRMPTVGDNRGDRSTLCSGAADSDTYRNSVPNLHAVQNVRGR